MGFRKHKYRRIIKGGKRHPAIRDNVGIYAEATILGRDVLIGENSVIGGNVWLTESVPPGTTVTISKPQLVYRKKGAAGALKPGAKGRQRPGRAKP